MTLEDLGYNTSLEEYRQEKELNSLSVGRVTSEHKERYLLKTDKQEYEAEIIGNLRYSAKERSDFPAVGDWVSFSEYDDNKALVHVVFPRKTIIERQAVGKFGEKQIIFLHSGFNFLLVTNDFSEHQNYTLFQ